MNLTKRSSLADVARCVGRALRETGVRAVLTGGACASLHSRGAYQSSDLDFVLQNTVSRATLDAAMARAGFRRSGNHYEHPKAVFFVEFPAGPLAIGGDVQIQPITVRIRGFGIAALSPTDSCRDRLAAFYHWNDRQSLKAAIAIGRRHRIDLQAIRAWSTREGALQRFEEFGADLRRERRRRR
jgi:hypothetical protein